MDIQFFLVLLAFVQICLVLGVLSLGFYALILLIKAFKIYIRNNS
ncbi:hypothetical protein NSA42_06765 [Paeniclostridium sordellii]|nr:hypothetical protein [Paeniclostridium sordellii]MCR1848974.1 hypothetical protein [Paeniclostridium sordellii]